MLETCGKSQGCGVELSPSSVEALCDLSPLDLDFFNEFVCELNFSTSQLNLSDCLVQLCRHIERDMATLVIIEKNHSSPITITAAANGTHINSTPMELVLGTNLDPQWLDQVEPHSKLNAALLEPVVSAVRLKKGEDLLKPSIDDAFAISLNDCVGVLLLHSSDISNKNLSAAVTAAARESLMCLVLQTLLRQHQYIVQHQHNVQIQHELRNILRGSEKKYSYWLDRNGWTHVDTDHHIEGPELFPPSLDQTCASKTPEALQSKLADCLSNHTSTTYELIVDSDDKPFQVVSYDIKPFELQEESISGLCVTATDVTKSWQTQKSAERNAAADRWLNSFLSWVLNQGDILAIEQSLEILTKHFNVSRCFIRTFENLAEEWVRLSSWHAAGQKSIGDELSTVEINDFLLTVKNQLLERNGSEICLEDLALVPNNPVAQYFQRFNLKSVLIEPMMYEGQVKGYLGMASIDPKQWTHQEKRTLKICAETFHRVLKRLQLLEQLQASEERFHQALETSSSGIWEWDLNKKEMHLSHSFCRMLGYERNEIGDHPRDQVKILVPESERANFIKQFNDFFTSTDQDELYHETPHIKKDGRQIWIAGRGRVVKRDENGYPMIVIGANTDIDAIQSVRQSLIQARAEAEKANLSKGEFLARMSHEIRTPMNAIIGMSYLMRHTRLNDEQKSYIEDIEAAASALLNIIDDILDFSKIEAGKLSIESTPFNLHQELRRIIKLIGLKVSEKNIAVKLDIDPAVPTKVIGDKTRFGQVVTNLLSNAVKFTQEGEIALSARTTETKDNRGSITLLFSVSDTGIGLTEEQTAQLFKPYEQAEDSTSRKFGGTGLGLAICKNLVALMGGNIEVISLPKVGTTFIFSIMFKLDDSTAEIDSKSYTNTDIVKNLDVLKNKSILLVEDNLVNQRVAQGILQRIGMNVVVANNGKEALEILKKSSLHSFCAVLMDIEMPILDGLQTTDLIRSQASHFQQVPIIAMTAHAMSGDREKCSAVGMNAHIAKPINPTSVYKVLVEQIQQGTRH